ncbi:MAG TPA: J domain-containing protein [Caulobacteraceae bacterium]|nr:J domain-containing protein [Caulobacteraceae bacterium]
MEDLDPYRELGLSPGCSDAEIRAAYRRQAQHCHPDAGGTPEIFERITLARDVLLDPERRPTFDRTGKILQASADIATAQALMVLAQAFAELTEPENARHAIDVIKGIGRMLARARERRRAFLDTVAEATDRMERLAASVRRKDQGANHFAQMAARQRQGYEAELKRFEEWERASALALKILGDYETAKTLLVAREGEFWA